MKRAKDTSFVPWDGAVRTIHYRQVFADDDPVVLAFPSLFDPWSESGDAPAVEAAADPAPEPAAAEGSAPDEPSPTVTGWGAEPSVVDETVVVKERRGRGRRAS